ncbi:MAG TPA: GNAT family N-acetyltransferase [Telluria sp.]|jgi:GNAT superfamily N-acetyltransferase
MVEIHPFGAADWPTYRDLRLQSLAQAPDAFGSTLAAERAYTDEHWRGPLDLASSSGRDLPLLARAGGSAAGLAWAKVDPQQADAVNLFQMWVHPATRGRGIGLALVQAVIAWAVGAPAPLREGTSLLSQAMHLQLAAECDSD